MNPLLHLAILAATGVPCLTATPPPAAPHPPALRFGITPQLAGSAGTAQGNVVPEDPRKTLAALKQLRPRHRRLVLRLNRLFESDGGKGIAAFARRVDRYARAGFAVEVQIRYHPAPAHDGDMRAWTAFVRRAADTFARRRAVVALSVTNETNFPVSPNTSDGSFKDAKLAVVRGVVAARRELDRRHRRDVAVGFTVAWRWLPNADAQYWSDLGRLGGRDFRRALGYVGLQIYPGLVYPPVELPLRGAGREVAEALTLLRSCYLPRAGIGRATRLWVSENGYATNRESPTAQAADLSDTVTAVRGVARALNVTDYRYFNLRDNDSNGTGLFDAVGLLRDDYGRKPAFGAFRTLIRRFGRRP